MNEQVIVEDEFKFLLFRLGEGLYGTPLLAVREVIEAQKVKPLPNALPYFKGLINLRGQVIGVVDLRARMGVTTDLATSRAYLVFELGTGSLAAVVDRVQAVVKIEPSAIQNGVATVDEQIVVLINLAEAFAEMKISA